MARCDYCNSFILFGGKQKSGRTFCNDECLQEGRLMMAADRIPQHAVDDAVEEAHQGKCSLCNGPGPIDVHTSHTIWSIVALTSWKSTPYVCCRSCGRQKQLTGFVTSGGSGNFDWRDLGWIGSLLFSVTLMMSGGQQMDAPKVDPKQFVESFREEMEAHLQAVMQAVNDAPDGEWIAGSEEQVRDLSAEFRKRVFEQAVQQRIDAAEAAFPPSASNQD